MKSNKMIKRPKPTPVDSLQIRYRGVWPMDRPYPIVEATTDCIMRLLCSSVFNGFAHGQIAYAIEKKLKSAQEVFFESWKVVIEQEKELKDAFPFIGENVPVPTEMIDAFKKANDDHRKLMIEKLEGQLFTLQGHEVELLRKAIEVCHDPTQYVDKTKMMTQEHMRWYIPILHVLMGSVTEKKDSSELST